MPDASHLPEATLCFLLRDVPQDCVLLGYKKTGFGAGKYGGFGGKVEPGETILQATARELWEETNLQVQEQNLHFAAHLTFMFPHRSIWNQIVHTYIAYHWLGEPVESREMKPAWFPLTAIPYAQMWQDCQHWLPHVLAGKCLNATFTFAADNETVQDKFLKY